MQIVFLSSSNKSENVLAKYIPFKFAINVEFILCETENIILLGLKLFFIHLVDLNILHIIGSCQK